MSKEKKKANFKASAFLAECRDCHYYRFDDDLGMTSARPEDGGCALCWYVYDHECDWLSNEDSTPYEYINDDGECIDKLTHKDYHDGKRTVPSWVDSEIDVLSESRQQKPNAYLSVMDTALLQLALSAYLSQVKDHERITLCKELYKRLDGLYPDIRW